MLVSLILFLAEFRPVADEFFVYCACKCTQQLMQYNGIILTKYFVSDLRTNFVMLGLE